MQRIERKSTALSRDKEVKEKTKMGKAKILKRLGRMVLSLGLSCTFLGTPSLVKACTLYGATGSSFVEGGGTLVAKNRDFTPKHGQMVELVKPIKGVPYYGLFETKKDGTRGPLRAGLNEKGLYVANSAASNLPRELVQKSPQFTLKGVHGSMAYLLANSQTVDEALKRTEAFKGPKNLILADKTKLAIVEIYPDGTYAVEVKSAGYIYHTNHYVLGEGLKFNPGIKPSTFYRYARMGALLNTSNKPLTMSDFITFSEDRSFGLDNSIYREGSKPNSTQTLAVFMAHLPLGGKPEIYVKYRATPEGKGQEKVVRYSFN